RAPPPPPLAWVTLDGDGPRAATAELAKVRELEPDAPDLHAKLGIVLLRQSKTDEAVAELERSLALRLGPAFDVRVNLGVAYLRQNRLQQAAAELQQALRIEPDHAD